MFITLNQFLQRVWYTQEVEVIDKAHTGDPINDGETVLSGKTFMVQRDENYWRYEKRYIKSFGAYEDKLVIVLN